MGEPSGVSPPPYGRGKSTPFLFRACCTYRDNDEIDFAASGACRRWVSPLTYLKSIATTFGMIREHDMIPPPKALPGMDPYTKEIMSQDYAFSSRQLSLIVDKVISKVDLPFINAGTEHTMVHEALKHVNSRLDGAMRSCIPDQYVNMCRILLNDQMEESKKKLIVNEILQKEHCENFTNSLNGKVNIPMCPEDIEQKVFGMACHEVIEEVADRMVRGIEKSGWA